MLVLLISSVGLVISLYTVWFFSQTKATKLRKVLVLFFLSVSWYYLTTFINEISTDSKIPFIITIIPLLITNIIYALYIYKKGGKK